MDSKIVLVIGGAGFIGSYVNKLLAQRGYKTVVLDNLSRGNRQSVVAGEFVVGDTGNPSDLDYVFKRWKISGVMHFAAFINVGDSITDPAVYYTNNVVNTLNVLKTMIRYEVKNLIFSSTAAIFGIPQGQSVTENHPTNPINPYGESKLMVEKMLRDFDRAYGLRSCCLRYFNAAGGDPEGIIKNRTPDALNLIPIVLRSLQQTKQNISIFGTDYPTHDGTCIRDYIHIHDLATAHITALEHLWEGAPSTCYNLGNGRGFSVREVINSVNAVTGLPVNTQEAPRRPGDPPFLLADSKKATQELKWTPQYPALESMISHAWQAMQ